MIDIRTSRLRLRSVTMAEAPAIARLAGDFGIARMTGRMPHPYRLHHARAYAANLLGSEEIALAILQPCLIGVCGIIPREDRRDEIGYWLGRAFWGRGFAGEVAAALIAHAFESRGARQVLVSHFDDNAASRRVILGQGFEQTGRDDAWCTARAANVPCLRYSLTRERWLERRGR